jgi:hypothetical protein
LCLVSSGVARSVRSDHRLQQDVHRTAFAVAGDRGYLVPPVVIGDIASRLTGAWDGIRIQTRTLGPAEAEPVIT